MHSSWVELPVNRATASIIIPAHNEASSLGRCLSSLLEKARPGEFEVIVVCNGCTDDTAGIARAFGSRVRVIEIEEGNKVLALNLGNTAARFFPRLYLDGDLEITTAAARLLVRAVSAGTSLAAIGCMELDLSGTNWLLRQYYAVWARHAYLRNGKFGGVYALSEEGYRRVGVLPRIINDDEYVRRSIPADRVHFEGDCSFRARMPRTFRDLYRVRKRVHRGNRQLKAREGMADTGPRNSILKGAWQHPELWVGLAVYLGINGMAKLFCTSGAAGWGRDESTRHPASAGQP